MSPHRVSFAFAALLCAVASGSSAAQKTYTVQDYSNAEQRLGWNVNQLMDGFVASPAYLPDGRVFYSEGSNHKNAYFIADPAHGTKAPAFDSEKLANALSAAGKDKVQATQLRVSSYMPEANGFSVETAQGKFHCNTAATKCMREPDPPPAMPIPQKPGLPASAAAARPAASPARGRRRSSPENASPDKKLVAFIRDNNLWVRTVATGQERQLTTDGVEDFGYATDNAGWEHSDMPILTWSDDSKKIATFQLDQRKTGMMYLVSTTNRHPELEAWHYPLVGDKDVTMIEPVIIDVQGAFTTRLKIAPLQHRSMECDDVSCNGDGKWTDVEFSPDNSHLAFVSTSRDHKDEWVKIADTTSGDVRDVYHEHVDTYYGWQAKTDWKFLPATNEFLWVSERSNWAQLYLYDLNTGKLKNQITHGDGPVWDLANVDEKNRVIYFTATGKEPGTDPYFRKLYRVNFDGSGQTLLTPENMDHEITMAADASSFVDDYSTAQNAPTIVIRDHDGKVLMPLGKGDVTRLIAAGWKPPVRITVKARDGKTDLWGYMWKPVNLDPAKKYPVVDYIYPGPQDAACTLMGHNFKPAHGDMEALTQLGFVAVCIDGMGNPHRSKSFHDAHASTPEEMGDDTIPDQVSGIKDLATQFSFIDVNRVGIWGHSGGGNATVSAMFHFPNFFKVGWAESGNHDNRDYEDDWDERWAGLEVIGPDGKSNYDAHANQNYAKNLKGKLMLVHGTMDDNVPPSNTLLVVDALMKANKDFDLLMVPNAHHGYPGDQSFYVMRRRWDYFVQNLAGGVPPAEFHMTPYAEVMKKLQGPSE